MLDHEIFRILSRNGATAESSARLPEGLGFVRWHNEYNDTVYDKPGHHALSIYLDGGQQTTRLEAGNPVARGFPGAVCLLPADSISAWRIRAPFRFLHFYFNDAHLAQTIARTWDREPGTRTLDEHYLFKNDTLATAARLVIAEDWCNPAGRLGLDHLSQWLLLQIARDHTRHPMRNLPQVPGRLDTAQSARIREFIETHLAETLTLDVMARVLHLSPYHFARLFRATVGLPPHQYVLRRRMAKADELLRQSDEKIISIALRCGFSDHSQFTRAFRRHHGVTPHTMRRG